MPSVASTRIFIALARPMLVSGTEMVASLSLLGVPYTSGVPARMSIFWLTGSMMFCAALPATASVVS